MKKYYFEKIHIETVLGCNYKCIMCPNNADHQPIEKMRWPLFKKIITEVVDLDSVKSIKLSLNGEPLLDKEIIEKIKYIKNRKNIRTTLNTNASLLNSKLSLELIYAGIDRINFHISGFGEDNYSKITKGKSFKVVLKNVLEFQKLLKETKRNMVLAVKFVVLKENENILEIAKAFWEDKGFLFRPDSLNNRNGNLKNFNLLRITDPKSTEKPCPLIYNNLFVRYNGEVVSCWSDWYGERVFGNCNNNKLLEIFNSKQFNQLRKDHNNLSRNQIKICKHCNWEEKND